MFYRRRLNCVYHLICALLLAASCVAQAQNKDDNPAPLQDDDVVVARFPDIYEAKAMVRSLRGMGQKAEIRHQTKSINLKTISITGYKSLNAAEKTVARLKKHGIDAYPNRISNHDYVVHAGAIHDEVFFWGRYERLKSLGYNKLSTGVKPYDTDYYAIVQTRSVPEFDYDEYRANRPRKTPSHGELLGRLNEDYKNFSLSSSNRLSALLHGDWRLNPRWELALGMRIDAMEESAASSYQHTSYDPLANYIAYHKGKQSFSAGWQTLNWSQSGRESWSNALNPKDLSYYITESDVRHRHRSVAALRWETEFAHYHLDTVWLPLLRAATLPDKSSLWYPVNQSAGKIRGVKSTTTYAQLIEQGVFNTEESRQSGSLGVQLMQKKGSRYQAFTLQYARLSDPYFKLNDTVRQRLAGGQSVSAAITGISDTFTIIHPQSWIFSVEEGTPQWQFEVSLLDGLPLTGADYQSIQAPAMEAFVNTVYRPHRMPVEHHFALHGRAIGTDRAILQRKYMARYEGKFLWRSESHKWVLSFDYQLGLDKIEAYANPRLSYHGNQFLEVALAAHAFLGQAGTEYGYHNGQAVAALEWNARF